MTKLLYFPCSNYLGNVTDFYDFFFMFFFPPSGIGVLYGVLSFVWWHPFYTLVLLNLQELHLFCTDSFSPGSAGLFSL